MNIFRQAFEVYPKRMALSAATAPGRLREMKFFWKRKQMGRREKYDEAKTKVYRHYHGTQIFPSARSNHKTVRVLKTPKIETSKGFGKSENGGIDCITG